MSTHSESRDSESLHLDQSCSYPEYSENRGSFTGEWEERLRSGTEHSPSNNCCCSIVWGNSPGSVAWSCQHSPQKCPQKPVIARRSSANKSRLQNVPARDKYLAVPMAHGAIHSLYPNISISANNFSWKKWVIHKYISFQERKDLTHSIPWLNFSSHYWIIKSRSCPGNLLTL